jgi:hypothetical protein
MNSPTAEKYRHTHLSTQVVNPLPRVRKLVQHLAEHVGDGQRGQLVDDFDKLMRRHYLNRASIPRGVQVASLPNPRNVRVGALTAGFVNSSENCAAIRRAFLRQGRWCRVAI